MPDEKPPILKKWSNVYLLVIVVLVLMIIFLYAFTNYLR
jgi:hypothetical protein